jgi:hypothetical protein
MYFVRRIRKIREPNHPAAEYLKGWPNEDTRIWTDNIGLAQPFDVYNLAVLEVFSLKLSVDPVTQLYIYSIEEL